MTPRYKWLVSVVNAHPDHKVSGRLRLQKTIRLLQRLGLPTNYQFQMHIFGPYSEGLLSEVKLLEQRGCLKEDQVQSSKGDAFYLLTSIDQGELPDVSMFKEKIDLLSNTETVVLELAATYDAYRALGFNNKDALVKLRNKKGDKCNGGKQEKAMTLLQTLGLSTK